MHKALADELVHTVHDVTKTAPDTVTDLTGALSDTSAHLSGLYDSIEELPKLFFNAHQYISDEGGQHIDAARLKETMAQLTRHAQQLNAAFRQSSAAVAGGHGLYIKGPAADKITSADAFVMFTLVGNASFRLSELLGSTRYKQYFTISDIGTRVHQHVGPLSVQAMTALHLPL